MCMFLFIIFLLDFLFFVISTDTVFLSFLFVNDVKYTSVYFVKNDRHTSDHVLWLQVSQQHSPLMDTAVEHGFNLKFY